MEVWRDRKSKTVFPLAPFFGAKSKLQAGKLQTGRVGSRRWAERHDMDFPPA